MGNISQVLSESAPAQSIHDQSYVGELKKKWGRMLKGIRNEHTSNCMAVLMENQANHLMSLTEDTKSTNVGSFLKFVFPVLRRVWPNLIANEIVSVQPMTAPVGGVFFYDLQYGTTKGKVTAGQTLIKDFNSTYSSETIDQEIIGVGDNSGKAFTSTLDFVPVKAGTVQLLDTATGLAIGLDDGIGGLTGTDSVGGILTGTVSYTTGSISVSYATAPHNAATVAATYLYNMEGNTNVPQVNINIQLISIQAKTRKLKALWSSEAADDLKAFHGIDAEAEVVAGVAAEIALELDREIIMDLYNSAALFSPAFNLAAIPSGVSEIYHIRSMVTTLTRASNSIHKSSLRGPANFLVTSPDVSAVIEQLETHGDFRPVFAAADADTKAPVEQPHTFGVYKVGTLASKYTCYKDPYFPVSNGGTGSGVGDVLMGYKGSTFIDAGFVWAPYIPLQITATFLDPADFTLRKGLRTRYATKMLRSEFYRRVRVTGL